MPAGWVVVPFETLLPLPGHAKPPGANALHAFLTPEAVVGPFFIPFGRWLEVSGFQQVLLHHVVA